MHFLTWDYRQQPDLDELDRMVYDISATGRPCRVYTLDTGSDEVAIAVVDEKHTPEEATAAYFKAQGIEL